eukprot:augustus_masked-scaffold_31-processed-gene-0.38-mRNA-1 protein AED:1.00 eAED:1.00 QI:0/0/0/0/1/1/2/0/442
MQRLQRMVNVSSASGRWFCSKLPEKAAGVATFLCNELASQVTDTDGRSDRILKLVVKLGGKRSLVLVNTYAPHCGHGQETYKMYLKELKSKLNGVNKRRLVLICCDFNAQVSRKELNVEGKLGLSHRTNTNGKLLVEFLKVKELTICNHLAVTGKKGSRKHATFMPRSNSGGPSEIDYVITNHIPTISHLKMSPKISYNLWMERNFDHLATSVRINIRQDRTAVAAETIEAVTKYKYLGAIFDPQGINTDAITKKLNEAHNHINRFRDKFSSSNIQKKSRINLTRALLIVPTIYNVENWSSNVKITKTLTTISRRLKKVIDKIDGYSFQLEEGDLDLASIVTKRQENHRCTARGIVDKELAALRDYQLRSPSPPPTVKPIYYDEALALLGKVPVPSESPHHPTFPTTLKMRTNLQTAQETGNQKSNWTGTWTSTGTQTWPWT